MRPKFSWLLVILGWIAIVPPAFADDAPAPRKVALIVANGDYRVFGRLPNPPNDARLVGETFKNLGFQVVVVVDASSEVFRREVASFSQRANNADAAVFYYSGHGAQIDGHNYLIPVDMDANSTEHLKLSAVDLDLVLPAIGRARVGLAFLDACRDVPFRNITGATRSLSRGLAAPASVAGVLIGFATSPGEVAEDGTGGNSPYAKALAKHLGEPELEVHQAMIRVTRSVLETTEQRQRPWVNDSLDQEVYLVPRTISARINIPPVGSVPSPTPPAPSADSGTADKAMELAFWNAIQNSDDPRDFKQYLQQYPNGPFAGLAKNKIDRLASKAAPTPPVAAPEPEQKIASIPLTKPVIFPPVSPFSSSAPPEPPPQVYSPPRQAWLGLAVQPVTPEIASTLRLRSAAGALVTGVAPGGPAERARILPGDVVQRFAGKDIASAADLPNAVATAAAGTQAQIVLWRSGRQETVYANLGDKPGSAPAASGRPTVMAFDGETQDFGVPPTNQIRTSDFEAYTPMYIQGARTVTTGDVVQLQRAGGPLLLIDVLGGNVIQSLPGAAWLPNAGLGTRPGTTCMPCVTQDLQYDLTRLTGGNKGYPLVFYCLSKTCWLSHNAVVRAVSLGYTNVMWYRGGRMSWEAANLPMGPIAAR